QERARFEAFFEEHAVSPPEGSAAKLRLIRDRALLRLHLAHHADEIANARSELHLVATTPLAEGLVRSVRRLRAVVGPTAPLQKELAAFESEASGRRKALFSWKPAWPGPLPFGGALMITMGFALGLATCGFAETDTTIPNYVLVYADGEALDAES